MFPLPNLSFGSGAGGGSASSGPSGWGNGPWTVNVAGSGTSLQSASAVSPWLIAAAVVGAWLLLRK